MNTSSNCELSGGAHLCVFASCVPCVTRHSSLGGGGGGGGGLGGEGTAIRIPGAGALYTEFSTLADLVEVVLLPDGLARTATSPNEAQACRIWTVTVRAKILPGTVAKGTLGRCTVQDIRRKLTEDCAIITPMLQSAHIIATPADVHEVLRTLGVVQMQPVAPPTLQAPMPPSTSSDSSAQIVRPGNNVQEYQKAYNASTGDHWFWLCGKKLSRSVRPSSSTFEQHCKTSQQHLHFMQENRPLQPRERTLLTFFPAKRSSGNPSPQSTPTMPTATSNPIPEQSVVPAVLPLPPHHVRKCCHLESEMQTIYAGHIHYYATDMRRPHGV